MRQVKWQAGQVILLLACACLVSPLGASLTPVNNPNGSEPNLINNSFQPSILNALYGAGNYTRIDDSLDQIWTANNGSVQVVAKFAGNNEILGYFSGVSGVTDGSTFHTLYNVAGSGYAVSGSTSGLNLPAFRWGLLTSAAQGTNYFSSKPSDNTLDAVGYNDHMVTFLITGTGGGFTNNPIGSYIIAFEDLINNPAKGLSSDRDFNDAVFEVKGGHLNVPEPSTYLLLGVMLLVAVARRQRLFALKRGTLQQR